MAGIIVLVLVIAGAIALAPYMGGLLLVALIIAVPLAILGLMGVGLERFGEWYDTTRVAAWMAHGPARVEMRRQRAWDQATAREAAARASATPQDTAGQAERVSKP